MLIFRLLWMVSPALYNIFIVAAVEQLHASSIRLPRHPQDLVEPCVMGELVVGLYELRMGRAATTAMRAGSFLRLSRTPRLLGYSRTLEQSQIGGT